VHVFNRENPTALSWKCRSRVRRRCRARRRWLSCWSYAGDDYSARSSATRPCSASVTPSRKATTACGERHRPCRFLRIKVESSLMVSAPIARVHPPKRSPRHMGKEGGEGASTPPVRTHISNDTTEHNRHCRGGGWSGLHMTSRPRHAVVPCSETEINPPPHTHLEPHWHTPRPRLRFCFSQACPIRSATPAEPQ